MTYKPLTADDPVFADLEDRIAYEAPPLGKEPLVAEATSFLSQAFAKADEDSWDTLTFLNTALFLMPMGMIQRGYSAADFGLDGIKSEQIRALKLDLTS